MKPVSAIRLFAVAAILVVFGISMSLRAEDAPKAPPAGGQARPEHRPGGPAPEMIFERIHKTLAGLNLNDDQKAKIKDVLEKTKAELEKIKPQPGDTDREGKRQQFMTIMKETHEQIMGVLNDEQKKAFQEETEKARKEFAQRQGGGQRPMGGILDRLKQMGSELNLTDEQKQKLEALGKEIREKAEQLHKENPDANLREKIGPIVKEKLEQILTPEQLEKVKAKMQGGPGGPGGRGGAPDGPGPRRHGAPEAAPKTE